jgi:alpha-1,6-mannosyltransferase
VRVTIRRRRLVELVVMAVLTVAAYAVLWFAQRSLWTNGLDATAGMSYPRPGADVGAGGEQAVAVIVLGACVTALFVWAAVRASAFSRAGLAWPLLSVFGLVAACLYLTTPTLSIDAYSYLSHGYLAATPGSNPYVDRSASVAGSPYGAQLLAQGWQAVHPQTPYGPLWTLIERLAYSLSGGNVYAGILLIKLPVLLAFIGTALLIRAFLMRTNRQRALRGTLLYVANPLILVELVGEGHNDGVMAFFLVLAIVAASRRWAFVAILAVAAAVLVKLNALPLAVPILVALIAMRRSLSRVVLGIVAGGAAAAAGAVLLIAPYWVGAATFVGLQASGAPTPGDSVAGWLSSAFGVDPSGVSPAASTGIAPGTVVQLVLVGLLILSTAAVSIMATTVRGLVRACGIVSIVIVLLLPLEWPWYATLPAAILPLGAGAADLIAIVAFTLGSRLVAPIGDAASLGVVGVDSFRGVQALVGQTIPAVIALVITVVRSISDRARARAS